MIIDASLGEMLAHQSVLAPYRQIAPMRSDRFVEWLRKRNIRLGLHDWQTLHHLWQIGVLHPVAVRDTADNGAPIPILSTVPEGRLLPVAEAWGGRVYADLGIDLADDAPLRPPHRIPSEVRDALLWHPFQLWAFHYLDRLLQRRYEWSLVLCGPDRHGESLNQSWRSDLAAVRDFGRSDRHLSFLRLVALLVAAEPLMHPWIDPTVRLNSPDRDIYQYFEWRESQVGYHLLGAAGLTIAEVAKWHWNLSFAAKVCDPFEKFRKLLRHADRDERERMKDDALCAHALYDTAEVLRRYLDWYHWYALPDEPDIDFPERNARINQERYGQARTSDFRRNMFRRIARQFGVDPGYRTYCFLEGPTEIGYVRRWAANVGVDLDRSGVRLVNLGGKDNIAVFEDQLRRLQEEEVFAVVGVDLDNPERGPKQARHVRRLKEFEAAGLLPVAFEVWRPNFVEHNFTSAEVVEMVVAEAARQGVTLALSLDAVEYRMYHDEHGRPRKQQMPLEKAIDGLGYELTGRHWMQKGESWGARLADWSASHPVPREHADSEGRRPIEAVCAMLLHGLDSDYALTAELSREGGNETHTGAAGYQ